MFSSEQFPRSHRRLALFGGLPGRHYHILLSVRDRAAMGSRAAVRAAGLAPFAVSGAHKALAYGLSAVMSTLLGMLAGVGGGMARHPAGGYSGRAARRLVCRGGVARRRNDLQVAILLYPGITAPPQRGRPWEVLFSCPPRRRKRSRAAKAPKLDIRGSFGRRPLSCGRVAVLAVGRRGRVPSAGSCAAPAPDRAKRRANVAAMRA